jgi:hypothetical protein
MLALLSLLALFIVWNCFGWLAEFCVLTQKIGLVIGLAELSNNIN